ncbi:hypothetical protein TIFTF001_004471 [Ficus carica]|uniref:Uncharacterized protein n=1 Tax=Ficus carica TaxID=3494 RepID=A0AA87ZBT2_FICCA|nr:hypothetical protein TIFTF001_004471 [Ficus carica]
MRVAIGRAMAELKAVLDKWVRSADGNRPPATIPHHHLALKSPVSFLTAGTEIARIQDGIASKAEWDRDGGSDRIATKAKTDSQRRPGLISNGGRDEIATEVGFAADFRVEELGGSEGLRTRTKGLSSKERASRARSCSSACREKLLEVEWQKTEGLFAGEVDEERLWQRQWVLDNISHGSLEGRFLGFWGWTAASSNKRSGIRYRRPPPLNTNQI